MRKLNAQQFINGRPKMKNVFGINIIGPQCYLMGFMDSERQDKIIMSHDFKKNLVDMDAFMDGYEWRAAMRNNEGFHEMTPVQRAYGANDPEDDYELFIQRMDFNGVTILELTEDEFRDLFSILHHGHYILIMMRQNTDRPDGNDNETSVYDNAIVDIFRPGRKAGERRERIDNLQVKQVMGSTLYGYSTIRNIDTAYDLDDDIKVEITGYMES